MKTQEIIQIFKTRAKELYGERLKEVVIFGSWARGDATDASDIDLAVVLEGRVSPCEEIDRLIDIITDITLEHEALISVYPVSERDYHDLKSPLLMNIRKEGVPA